MHGNQRCSFRSIPCREVAPGQLKLVASFSGRPKERKLYREKTSGGSLHVLYRGEKGIPGNLDTPAGEREQSRQSLKLGTRVSGKPQSAWKSRTRRGCQKNVGWLGVKSNKKKGRDRRPLREKLGCAASDHSGEKAREMYATNR